MSDLTAKFSTLEAELTSQADEAHSQRVTIIAAIGDAQTAVDNVGAEIITLRGLLLRAIGQNDPCATCPPPSLITPPTNPIGRPINADKCKRVHAYLNAMHEIAGVFGAATDNGILWTPSVITAGLSEVITTLITGGSVPLPSFGEAVNIAGDAINYGLSNIGRNNNLQTEFDSISSGMANTLYNAPNASALQSEYAGLVDASALPGDEKLLFKALGYNALLSYFFDPTSTPDLTGYSGTDCGELACMVFTPEESLFITGEFGTGYIPDWGKYGLENVSLPGQDNAVWVCIGPNSATWDTTGYADVYKQTQQNPGGGTTAETGNFGIGSGCDWITIVKSAAPFALTLCGTSFCDECS